MANPPTDPDLLARGLAPAVGMKYKALFPAKRNPRYGIGDDRKETHPRWSQEIETDIGTGGRRPTLLYNGYEQQVGSMYNGKEV